MNRRNFSKLLILSFLFMTGVARSYDTQEKFEKTIPFEPGGYVAVTNQNGNIQVSSWNEKSVQITAFKKVNLSNSSDAEKWLKMIDIEIIQHDHEIKINTHTPEQRESFLEKFFSRHNVSCSVEYEIKVPQKTDLNLQSSNGNIDVREIEGRIRLETTNGNIDAVEINGLARCETTNGSIHAEFEQVPDQDRMSFETTNGSIKIFLPEDFGGDFDLNTINGSITSDFPIKIEGRWGRKHFQGQVQDGHCSLDCSTINGSIDVLYIH
jgi:DUF4097 and DUF4098 domain-containing protein YvlB